MKNKIAAIIFIVIFFTSISSISNVSSSLIAIQTIEFSGQILNLNYKIWTENGVYYANNTYGIIEYSSPVASNVLNYASSELTNGGIIFVMDGTYVVNKWTITQPNLYVIGESQKTIFTIPNGFNDIVINILADNVTLKNVKVNGNMANQDSRGDGVAHGIQVWGASNFIIENCFVTGCWSEAIVAQNGANHGVIRGCRVEDTRISGITLYGKAGSTTTTNTRWITVSDCVTVNCGLNGQLGNGVYFGGVDYCFAKNLFINTTSDCGFEIQGGVNQNSFSHGCEADNITCVNTVNSGIYLDGAQSYPLYDPVVTNFNVTNSTGIFVSTYVENPIISSGVVESTRDVGIHLYNHVVNGKFDSIIVNGTVADGAKIDGEGCTNNTLDKITLLNVATYGLEIASGNSNNTLQNSKVAFGNYGVYTTSDYTSIVNNDFSGGLQIAIYFASNYNNIFNNRITAPTATLVWAIYGVSSINSTIQSNQISNIASGGGGIEITGGANINNSIANNYITAASSTSGTGILFYSSGGASSNKASGNTIVNCFRGVDIRNAAVSGTTIADNHFISCATPISDLGSNTILVNNTFQ